MKKTYKKPFYSNFDEITKLKKEKFPIIIQRKKYYELKTDFFNLSDELQELITKLENIKDYEQYFINEELEFSDIALAMLFGIFGSFISTNEELQEFFRLFHDESSNSNKLQKSIKKFFEHKNNPIDYDEEYKFINRNGGKAKFGFHRLFYGHDILSFKGDNPFYLYTKKFGFLKGIKNAITHLIADTCSKQGLPLPGSSIFDIKNGDELTNYIYEFVKKISNDSSKKVQEAYQQLFTYHIQDSLGTGTTKMLSSIYLKIRNFETEHTKNIFNIITNISELIITAIIGLVKTKGFTPKINWAILPDFFIHLGKFIGIKIKEHKIKKLEKKYNSNVIILENYRKNIYKIYRINYFSYTILIIAFIILSRFILLKSYNKETLKISSTTYDIQVEKSSIISIGLGETKSFEFRADRCDYVNNDDAKSWCDNTAIKINNILSENSTMNFVIKGYTADFDNEINDITLSLQRAEKIKEELVSRGIPGEILKIEPIGKTNRWGLERKNNRAATIESY